MDLTLVGFMDDLTGLQVFEGRPAAEEIADRLNCTTEALQSHLDKGGWRLNPGKTAHLIGARGSGSRGITMKISKKKTQLKGEAGPDMRVLGPYIMPRAALRARCRSAT